MRSSRQSTGCGYVGYSWAEIGARLGISPRRRNNAGAAPAERYEPNAAGGQRLSCNAAVVPTCQC